MANYEDDGRNGIYSGDKGYYKRRKEVQDTIRDFKDIEYIEKLTKNVEALDDALNRIKQNAPKSATAQMTKDLRTLENELDRIQKRMAKGESSFSNTKEMEAFAKRIIELYDDISLKIEQVNGNARDSAIGDMADDMDELADKVDKLAANMDLLKKNSPFKEIADDANNLLQRIVGVKIGKDVGSILEGLQNKLTGSIGGVNNIQDILNKMSTQTGRSWSENNDMTKRLYKTNQNINKSVGKSLIGNKQTTNYLQTLVTIGWKDYRLAEESYASIIEGVQTLGLNTEQQAEFLKINEVLGETQTTEKIMDMLNAMNMNTGEYGINLYNSDNVTNSVASTISSVLKSAGERGLTQGSSEMSRFTENAATSLAHSMALMEAATGDSSSFASFIQNMTDADWEKVADTWTASGGLLSSQYSNSEDLMNDIYSGDYTKVAEGMLDSISDFYQNNQYNPNSGLTETQFYNNLHTLANQLTTGAPSGASSELNSIMEGFKQQYATNNGKSVDEIKNAVNQIMDNSAGATKLAEKNQNLSIQDRLMNWMENNFGRLFGAGGFFSLGQLAFGAYLASGAAKLVGSTFKFFANNGGNMKAMFQLLKSGDVATFFKNGGSVKELFSTFFGKTSTVGSSLASTATGVSTTAKSTSLLSGAGGILAAGGGILLGLAAANAIKGAIEGAAAKTEERNRTNAELNLQGTKLEGNSVAASLDAMGATYSDENNNFMKGFGSGIATTVRGIGTGLLGWTRDLSTINQDDWKYMRESMNMHKMNADQVRAYTLAWGLLLMSAGRKGDVDEFKDYNKDYIKAVMDEYGYSKSYLDKVVESFNGTMTKPNKSTKENQETIDWQKLGLGGGYGNVVPTASFGIGGAVHPADPNHKPPITAGYDRYPSGGKHKGVDFGVVRGTPIGSSVSGKVESLGSGITREGWLGNNSDFGGWGNHVRIRGNDGNLYTFAHLSSVNVAKGQEVHAGTLLGKSGNTGNTTGPHLHYQVNLPDGSVTDPFNYFSDSMWNIGDTSGDVAGNIATSSTTDAEGNERIDLFTRTAGSSSELNSYYNTKFGHGGGIESSSPASLNNDDVIDTLNVNFKNLGDLMKELSSVKSSQEAILEQLAKLRKADAGDEMLYSY